MADRTRYTANLVSDSNLYVDIATDRVGIGTTNPTSKLTVNGDVNLIDGLFMMDSEINTNITVPTGKNALMIGPTTIGIGYTVLVESNATLVVI